MDRKELEIRNARNLPKQVGKSDYLKHLKGERLTRDKAIKAKCYECVGGEDTRPCNVITCALSQYCQWNPNKEVRQAS